MTKQTQKKTIYLHIGQAKTASSTLQNFLYTNRDILNKKGVYFPVINPNPKPGVMRLGANARHLSRALSSHGNHQAKEIWKTLYLPEIEKTPHHKIVLSDELFSFIKASFFKKIDLTDYQIKIIVYIRPSIEYLASAWGQAVRSSFYKNFKGSLSLQEFLDQKYTVIDVIKTYIEYFGRDNIILRPFEKKQFKEGDLYTDFLHCLDLPMIDDYNITQSKHPSIGRDLAELSYIVNNLDLPLDDHTRLKRKLFEDVVSEPKIVETLTDQQIKEITDRNASQENWLAQELLDQPTLFTKPYPSIYQKERPSYTHISLSSLAWDVLKEAIHLKQDSHWKRLLNFLREIAKGNVFLRNIYMSIFQKRNGL